MQVDARQLAGGQISIHITARLRPPAGGVRSDRHGLAGRPETITRDVDGQGARAIVSATPRKSDGRLVSKLTDDREAVAPPVHDRVVDRTAARRRYRRPVRCSSKMRS